MFLFLVSTVFLGFGFLLQKELELALGFGRHAVNPLALGVEDILATSLGEPQFSLVLGRAWKLSNWFFGSIYGKRYFRNSLVNQIFPGNICVCS